MSEKRTEEELEEFVDLTPESDKPEFLPSLLAERLLQLEEKEGRSWNYVPEREQFFFYRDDQGVWEETDVTYLKKACRGFLRAREPKWDKSSKVKELVSAIKAQLTDRTNRKKFNAGQDPDLGRINLKNGVLDWREEQLFEHNPDDYSLFQIPVEYHPDAGCPRWRQALQEWIPNERTRLFLQEFVGYCLVPDISHHKAVILFGSGRNGKSTFLETLAKLFGEQNLSHIELSRLTERFETAHLKDKLVNICSDLDPTFLKRTGIIKTVVAGEPLRGEHKFQPSFDFKPVVRLMFSCNQLPEAKDKSVAWYRRFEFVKFPNEFKPGDESYDRHLKQKLTKEKPGILNWALRGLKRLEKQDEFTGSEALKKAKNEYRYQNDTVLAFLEEKVEDREGTALPKKFLYRRYKEFCKNSGLRRISRQKFSRRLGAEFGLKDGRDKFPACEEHERYRCGKCSSSDEIRKRMRCFLNVEVE